MTLYQRVQSRIVALIKNHNRKAIGIVCDYNTYKALIADESSPFSGEFIPQSQWANDDAGDKYYGLDVAITKKPDTLIVY